MEIFAVHPSDGVQAFADLLRNICNCTLSLLFTIALCMWGFVFNRRAAWRTDGGTAVFGAGANVFQDTYQLVPKTIDDIIGRSGGERFYKFGEGDIGVFLYDTWEEWRRGMWAEAQKVCAH